MAYNFNGKKILVTGAGRNIGRGIATGLAKLGAKVYALDYIQENLEDLVTEEPEISIIHHDLQDWDETVKIVEKLEGLNGLVNCAGILFGPRKAVDTPKENLEKTMNVNLLAAINMMQIVGKKMISAGKGGSIVNISSQGSMYVRSGLLPYCVSKAGLDMATKMFAQELGPHKIRVNSVNPGIVETEMARIFTSAERLQHIAAITPLQRNTAVQDIVDLVLFLLSDHSLMINGTHNLVNGGVHLANYVPVPGSSSPDDSK